MEAIVSGSHTLNRAKRLMRRSLRHKQPRPASKTPQEKQAAWEAECSFENRPKGVAVVHPEPYPLLSLALARMAESRHARLHAALEFDHANRQRYAEADDRKATAYHVRRARRDPAFKAMMAARGVFSRGIRHPSADGKSFLALTGCTPAEMRRHLESQFAEGMTWLNQGKEWEIDHVRPCCAFDLSDPSQARECFDRRNLKPKRKAENREKGKSDRRQSIHCRRK